MRMHARVMRALVLLATLGVPVVSSERVAIDFGHGWWYHVGDDPSAGISGGIGAFDLLSGFKNMTSCAPMVAKMLYSPHGQKSAGQLWTDCAVACSYDKSCTAYTDERIQPAAGGWCHFGNASTKCTSGAAHHAPAAAAAEQPRLTPPLNCPRKCPALSRGCSAAAAAGA